MDNSTGNFHTQEEMEDNIKNRGRVIEDYTQFKKGEHITIKGQEFYVVGVENNRLILESMKKIQQKVGRNDFCPCKSGRKYKKCCGG